MTSAIEKIHEFERFGSVLGLERMNELLSRLGNPHEDLRVIHVAGTNGKGSVCKYLECALTACGYSVGTYTSPYIERFNERIRLGGSDISDEELEELADKVIAKAAEMVEAGLDSPTEFEVVTAIAFLYFMQKGADIAILEVGLGGSGDSTNVVKHPLVSVICSVSYDHMDRLGDTLEEIASDKAGIIKSGCPVISNVSEHEPAAAIARRAYEQGARLYDISGIRIHTEEHMPLTPTQTVSMEMFEKDYSDIEISMLGRHQAENLKTAAAAIEILRKAGKIRVERDSLYRGLKEAKQPGRFEILPDTYPALILDGAHNEAGACALRDAMKAYFPEKRVLLVLGVLADKDVDAILKPLFDVATDMIVTTPTSPRGLDAVTLGSRVDRLANEMPGGLCRRWMGISYTAETAEESVRLAKYMSKDYDAVLFAGSLYLIGEVRRVLREDKV